MIDNGINRQNENRENGVHPTLQKTFVVLAIISFGLGALVNYYTLKRLRQE